MFPGTRARLQVRPHGQEQACPGQAYLPARRVQTCDRSARHGGGLARPGLLFVGRSGSVAWEQRPEVPEVRAGFGIRGGGSTWL